MKKENETERKISELPACAAEYIKLVIKKMRYRRKVRRDVQAELEAHFEDELKDCATDEKKEQKAQQIIETFGDVKLLGVLLRRAKKRCRPLWRKALVRSFQTLGIIVLYLLVCFSPLIIGKPTISTDYVDWLNETVRAGRDEADNARPYYEEAAELYVKMPPWLSESRAKWPTDLNDVQLNSLSAWLEDNRQAIEMLREAAERPYYWNIYQSDETDLAKGLIDSIIQTLRDYKYLAYAMRWQIRYEAYNGDIDRALSDCIVLLKFGQHQQGRRLLVEQLVGIATEAVGQMCILDVVSQNRDNVTPDSLRQFQEQSEELIAQTDVISFEAEKAFFYDLVQRSFTDNGKGGGRVLLKGLPLVAGEWKSYVFDFLTMNLPDRREIISRIDKFYEQADNAAHKTALEFHKEVPGLKQSHDSLLLGILTPAFDRVINISWRLRTTRQALPAIVAVIRYEKEKGQYPESLSELTEQGYLSMLPVDLFSNKPLVYERIEDNFILYSIGLNFKDDGGEVFRDEEGRIKKWADEGDWVFWPVQRD